MRFHSKESGMRGRLRVTTRTIIGGLSVLLALVAAGCDNAGPNATPSTSPPSTVTATPTMTTSGLHIEAYYPCGPTLEPYNGGFQEPFVQWTPDGSRLMFDYGETIWAVDSEGTVLQSIVDANPGDDGHDFHYEFMYGFHADVSPEGSRIVHATCQYPNDDPPYGYDSVRGRLGYEIATIGIDGSDPQRLTETGGFESYPVWSPDGTRIAFVGSQQVYDRGHYDLASARLYTMAWDGSNIRAAITLSVEERTALLPPVCSPDGQYLAYVKSEGERHPLKRIL